METDQKTIKVCNFYRKPIKDETTFFFNSRILRAARAFDHLTVADLIEKKAKTELLAELEVRKSQINEELTRESDQNLQHSLAALEAEKKKALTDLLERLPLGNPERFSANEQIENNYKKKKFDAKDENLKDLIDRRNKAFAELEKQYEEIIKETNKVDENRKGAYASGIGAFLFWSILAELPKKINELGNNGETSYVLSFPLKDLDFRYIRAADGDKIAAMAKSLESFALGHEFFRPRGNLALLPATKLFEKCEYDKKIKTVTATIGKNNPFLSVLFSLKDLRRLKIPFTAVKKEDLFALSGSFYALNLFLFLKSFQYRRSDEINSPQDFRLDEILQFINYPTKSYGKERTRDLALRYAKEINEKTSLKITADFKKGDYNGKEIWLLHIEYVGYVPKEPRPPQTDPGDAESLKKDFAENLCFSSEIIPYGEKNKQNNLIKEPPTPPEVKERRQIMIKKLVALNINKPQARQLAKLAIEKGLSDAEFASELNYVCYYGRVKIGLRNWGAYIYKSLLKNLSTWRRTLS
jgi:hypothetical protein